MTGADEARSQDIEMSPYGEWIGVDLDGTLAHCDGWRGDDTHIGEPVPAMIDRVKVWLADGRDVRIFTARAFAPTIESQNAIESWCKKHIGQILDITCEKDPGMIALYDDRAVQVERNTGTLVGGAHDAL